MNEKYKKIMEEYINKCRDEVFDEVVASPLCFDGKEFGMFYMNSSKGRCYLICRL